MTSLIQGDVSTWTPQEFPQVTYNNGLARTDFDASAHDKKYADDKTFNLDLGSFVAPSTFPLESSKGGRKYALSWIADRLTDVKNNLSESKSDSIYISERLAYPVPHDTMKRVPQKNELIHRKEFSNTIKSINRSNGKEWHKKAYGW